MAGLKLITAPAVEPITLTEAKARLRVTVSDEDDDLTALIRSARAQAENEVRRAFITQTWSLILDSFPYGIAPIPIPLPPLQSITWIKYYDTAGTLQTLDTATYWVSTANEPGYVRPIYGQLWPYTNWGQPDSVEIRFAAGYGLAAAVPDEAKDAIKVIMTARRENPAGDVGIPPAARRLLDALEFGEV